MSNNPQIIQIFDSWGEFGATSFASQMACSLVKKGRVLVIDMHEKANATASLGKNFYDFWSRNVQLFLNKRYRSTIKENSLKSLHIKISHNLYLIAGFPHFPNQSFQVKKVLYNLVHLKDHYDYVIIDSSSFLNILNKKLFKISNVTLLPFSPSYISHCNVQKLLKSMNFRKMNQVNLFFVSKKSLSISNKNFVRLYKEFKQMLLNFPKKKIPTYSILKNELSEDINSYPEKKTTIMSLNDSSSVRKSIDVITEEVLDKLSKKTKTLSNRHGSNVRHYFPFVYKTVILLGLFILIQVVGVPFKLITESQGITLSFFEKENRLDLEYYFEQKQSLYKLVKWVISHHTAIVPTADQINIYIQEVIFLHNQSNPYSKRIIRNVVPRNTLVKFPPPSNIYNPNYHKIYPAYAYFLKMVKYKRAYVTGEWAERGLGGHRKKHQGLDVAAPIGTIVTSPIEGVAYLSYSVYGGKVVSIREGKNILYFGHLGKRLVKTGQLVHKGDPIGTIGLTGRTSGPHVHIGFGIEFPVGTRIAGKNYKFTDPLFFFYRNKFLSNSLNQ